MPNAEPGTDTTAATPAPTTETTNESPLAGFSAAIQGWGDSQQDQSGEPEEPQAVETSEADTATDSSAEKPVEKTETDAKEKAKPDAPKTVNFDGFSDKAKATYERLLKAGLVTPEEVEEARGGYLRQSDYSRKTMDLAKKREEFAKEKAQRESDLAMLDRIRGDERLLNLWERFAKGDVPQDSASDDELVDRKTMSEAVKKAIEADRQKAAAEVEREQKEYNARATKVKTMLGEVKAELGASDEALDSYLTEIAKEFPEGAPPIEYIVRSVDPNDLRKEIRYQHRIAVAEAKASAAAKEASQRTQRAVQASKQSLSPSAKAVDADVSMSPLQAAKRQLGITRLSEVQGAGFPTNGR